MVMKKVKARKELKLEKWITSESDHRNKNGIERASDGQRGRVIMSASTTGIEISSDGNGRRGR